MEELNLKDLERIAIPEGLEERLSQRIDEWAAAERRRVIRRRLAIAAAACAALLFGLAGIWNPATEPQGTGSPVEKLVVENKEADEEKLPEQLPVKQDLIVAQAPSPNTEPILELSSEEAEEIERQMRILQAKIDNELAAQTAELVLAEYYAQQVANGEEVGLPDIEATLGDYDIPTPTIMTLVME